MVKIYNSIHELEKLYQFIYGCHMACDHENSSASLHYACHKLEEIINNIKVNQLEVKNFNQDLIYATSETMKAGYNND